MKKTIGQVLIAYGCVSAASLYFTGVSNDSKEEQDIIEEQVEEQAYVEPILVKPNVEYIYKVGEVEKEIYVDRPVLIKPLIKIVRPSHDFNQEMLKGVKFFEGFRSDSYYCCANVKTIGYGCTDKNIVALKSISEYKASNILQADLNEVRDNVRQAVKVDLTEYQLNALTSFTFNCGLSNLKTLINGPGRLNSGNYESISKILPKYRIAGGKVREGLVKRRAWEVSLFNGNPTL